MQKCSETHVLGEFVCVGHTILLQLSQLKQRCGRRVVSIIVFSFPSLHTMVLQDKTNHYPEKTPTSNEQPDGAGAQSPPPPASSGGAAQPQPSAKDPEKVQTTSNGAGDNNAAATTTDQKDPEKTNGKAPAAASAGGNFPPLKDIPVKELYDRERYDLSTMEPTDVFRLLEYVFLLSFLLPLWSAYVGFFDNITHCILI